MTVAYGPRGLIGLLTPQANTTAEPEFAILLPPGIAFITARMVSPLPDLEARLVAYFGQLDTWVGQFANAPVDVLAIACTGASYLMGLTRERPLIAALAEPRGAPVVTSGLAVGAALTALDAKRVALVSPYPRSLTEASVGYWQSHGVSVARVVQVGVAEVGAAGADPFHPIYAMAANDAHAALQSLEGEARLDAVILLGTGMPTLHPILRTPRVAGAPVLSCVLATAWRSALHLAHQEPTRANLLAWLDQPEWGARLHTSF